MRGSITAVAVVCCVLLQPQAALATVIPTPVLTSSANEFDAHANLDYLVWGRYIASTHRYFVYGRLRAGGPSFRLNARGTSGETPDIQQGADFAIYQQWVPKKNVSDLYLYDLAARTRRRLPKIVDSPAWEYWPVMSSSYVAFMRIVGTRRDLYLYNRSTRRLRLVASSGINCDQGFCLIPDWVGIHTLVYDRCSAKTYACNPVVYNIGTQVKASPPKAPAPVSQYGAAYDESNGELYYVLSTTRCGRHVSLERWSPTGGVPPESLYAEPSGTDVGSVSLANDVTTPGDLDLLFSQFVCSARPANGDVYEIDHVNTIP